MKNDEKPVDIFSLFNGAAKPVETKETPEQPREDIGLEQELKDWLTVENDFLFEGL